MSHGCITGTKKVAQRCALLAMSSLDNRWAWPVSGRLKVTWSDTDPDAQPPFTQWSVDWRADCKVYTLCNNSWITYCSTWNLSSIVGGLVSSSSSVVAEIWAFPKRAHRWLPPLSVSNSSKGSLVPICSQCPGPATPHPHPAPPCLANTNLLSGAVILPLLGFHINGICFKSFVSGFSI